jgi:amidase
VTIRFDFEDLQSSAHSVGTHIHDYEKDAIVELAEWMAGTIDSFMVAARPMLPAPDAVPSHRVSGATPKPEEDPLNAVVRWVDIKAEDGETTSDLLAGKTIALKDLIAVAGIPISASSLLLDGFVPRSDAVVTQRVLRAGGHIVAMTNMEGMAWGGGGESGIFGSSRNPYDHGRSTSGSSGGSGAILFYDGVDLAFGTDQGGSIRLPASWCGVVGIKPTHSLVPYVGLASHDQTFDHVGPMARDTETIALAMAAVSGPFWGDARQKAVPELSFVDDWANAPDDFTGVTFGVLKEALISDGSEEREAALAGFADAIERFKQLGATVVEISIPEHAVAGDILFAGLLEGVAATLYGNGEGYHWNGAHSVDVRRAVGKGMLAFGDQLQPSYKAAAILGEYLRSKYFGEVYATAQSVIPLLREAYDTALAEVDVVLMPTTPTVAMELKDDASDYERQRRSFSMAIDTPAHNATGHPAISIPAAEAQGMPLGVMLVGKHFDDSKLIALSRTYEKTFGWLPENKPSYPKPSHV